MAERWQQWMPFHIDRFRGSPDVQAMHPTARSGYIYLLASAWQTDDCTVPNNPFDLASLSGLGDDLWAQYSTRILRKFEVIEGGTKLQNHVEFAEWKDAKRVYDARREAAIKTTKTRSPRTKPTVTVDNQDGHRTVTDGTPLRSADTQTITGTGTETTTVKQKQKTSPKAKPPVGKSETDPRRKDFIDDLKTHWERFANTPFVFDGKDATQVDLFLKTWPDFTKHEWRTCLANRKVSGGVISTQRIYLWIGRLAEFLNSPLNEFNKPSPNGGSNGNGANKIPDSIKQANIEFDARYGNQEPHGSDMPNAQPSLDSGTASVLPFNSPKTLDATANSSVG